MLASSNDEVQFAPESGLSGFWCPVTPSQSSGIEDARCVLFYKDDGTRTYYATYTAYDGKMICRNSSSDMVRWAHRATRGSLDPICGKVQELYSSAHSTLVSSPLQSGLSPLTYVKESLHNSISAQGLIISGTF